MPNFEAIGIRDAVAILNRPKRTVIHWVTTGQLPAQKLPGLTGAYVFDRAEVERFAETRNKATA